MAPQARLQRSRFQLSTAIGAGSSKHTPVPTASAAPAPLSLCSLSSFGSASLHCSARLRSYFPALVVEVSRDDYVQSQDICMRTMRAFDGETDNTPCSRKTKKITGKAHRKTHAQAAGPRAYLPSLFAFKAVVFGRYRFAREAGRRLLLTFEVPFSVEKNGHEQ